MYNISVPNPTVIFDIIILTKKTVFGLKHYFGFFFIESMQLCESCRFRMVLDGGFVNISLRFIECFFKLSHQTLFTHFSETKTIYRKPRTTTDAPNQSGIKSHTTKERQLCDTRPYGGFTPRRHPSWTSCASSCGTSCASSPSSYCGAWTSCGAWPTSSSGLPSCGKRDDVSSVP